MENVDERLGKAETSIGKLEILVDEHSRKFQMQEEKNEAQIELNTILKQNVEQMKQFEGTLTRINENLTNLNNQQAQLSNRVTDIEASLNESKNNKKDTWKFILTNIATFIMSVLLAYLLFKLGLNNGNLM